MKKNRILSLLLAFALALTLLPTAALAAEDIKTVAVTVTGVTSTEWGKPRPGIGAFSVADPNLQISNMQWTAADDGNVTYNNRFSITVDIKPGVDAKFVKETSIKATVNGESNGIVKKRKSDTQMTITYTIKVANPNEAAEQAAIQAAADAAIAATKTDIQSYDTFDYRAYANVYPDVKAAYGYDAQKLYAHYINYGKAEGRVAYYINAADNPKTGATYYKNANTGATYADRRGDANVPATYLDTLPPSNSSQAYDPWMLHQLTHFTSMSNAKLVAEWYRLAVLMEDQETGYNYLNVRMDRFWDLEGEINARTRIYEAIYCYENNQPVVLWQVAYGTKVDEKEYAEAKAAPEYGRVTKTDATILIHWAHSFNSQAPYQYKSCFPTPPADPGTVSGVTTSTAPAPAPAAKTVGGFSDVLESSSFAQPVVWAVEKGITGGKTATTFAPGETCTQAQILTFLWRAKGQPEPAGTANLPGLDSSKYYYKAVQWAAEQNMVDGSFNPDAACTRSTAMMYMWKQAGSPSAAAASFTDVSAGAAYAPAVNWAVANGVTTGTTATTFAPESPCTRGQIVTFLYRAFK